MNITEFLLARIAEDEDRAKMARGWQTGSRHEGQPLDWSIHMDRWSPDRVLAECETKRRIVELHRAANGDGACDLCGGLDADLLRGQWPCETLIALASVYADHPDFDPAWSVS